MKTLICSVQMAQHLNEINLNHFYTIIPSVHVSLNSPTVYMKDAFGSYATAVNIKDIPEYINPEDFYEEIK